MLNYLDRGLEDNKYLEVQTPGNGTIVEGQKIRVDPFKPIDYCLAEISLEIVVLINKKTIAFVRVEVHH
jgi:hypothetical protein